MSDKKHDNRQIHFTDSNNDIQIGVAVVKSFVDDGLVGWILPGCQTTYNRKVAKRVARIMDRKMQSKIGR